jgi:proteasome accessory factor A
VIKRDLLQAYIDRKGCGWEDSRVKLMDLQYHDLRPEKGLFAALERGGYVERVVTDEAVTTALTTPPPDTRAYFRARCLEKFPHQVYAASWASVVLDIGDAAVKRIPINEPARGTRDRVGALLDDVESAAELVSRLSA